MNDPATTHLKLSALQAHLAAQPDHAAAVASLCAELRAELQGLQAAIPAPVLRQLGAAPKPGRIGGEYWHGSVVFADLSGFTALSEQLSTLGKQGAEEISAIINRLFGALVDEIAFFGGEVLKFGGDALTAFFDRAVLGEAHAALAASAALALQQRMRDFAATETRVGRFRLRLRIGVHSGRVFAAQVGDVEHIELVVTGRNINRVALAQEIADSGDVVVSRETLALLEGATTQTRQSGFHLLSALPPHAPPQLSAPPWPNSTNDMAELVLLHNHVTALRPFLPRHLPRRFLHQNDPGEFRPVTMLFAHFFPFSSALDVLGDDAATAALVLNSYYKRAQEIVHRYGGIINKVDMSTYGDKLMALFGAPTAHENDPELAVRAALELRTSLQTINAEIAALLRPAAGRLLLIDDQMLRQRIGINTGVVFAGMVGGARRREYTVMGQHVNLAARAMSVAEENTVVVSASSQRAVERHVALRPLEPVKLKGIAEPVVLAEVLQPFGVAQDQPRGVRRARMIGRTAESAQIVAEGRAALRGAGRVVALVGEAGVGKSRLIEHVLRQLVLESAKPDHNVPPFFPYSVECQSYEQNTPYALVRQLMRQILQLDFLEHAGDAALITRRVGQLAPEMARFAPLLADVAVAQIADTPLTAALSPEQRHSRALELLETLLVNTAQQQPLFMMLDDMHWADQASLEFIVRLAALINRSPVMLVLSYRTEPQIAEPWLGLDHARQCIIRELETNDSATLVGDLLGAPAPAGFVSVFEKTQGNPFFIEEVVRSLIESGVLVREQETWQLARLLDETVVPNSIEGVITSRLDRLEERSREVLQVASVVGRRFPYQVLLGVLLKTDDLVDRLGRLTEAELILLEEIERETAYLFKHALTRDVAYEAILFARRRELHRGVAREIERLYPDRLDDQVGLLARHYLLAEAWPQAFNYHVRAGRQAQARFANSEAMAFLERALQISERLTTSDQPPLVEASLIVEIHERLGVIHALIGEYDPALACYHMALEVLQHNPPTPTDAVVRLHHHVARVLEKRAEFDTAFQWVEKALMLDPELDSGESVRVLLLGAGIHRRQGRFAQALEWGERARARAEALASVREQAEALMLLGGTYLGLGDNERALELTKNCLDLNEQIQNLPRLADAHNNLANICYELGRLDQARTHYQAGYEIKQAIGDTYGQAMIANNLGGVLKLLGNVDDAVKQYQQSLSMFEQLGSLYATGVLHMNLGAAYLLNYQFEQAEHHLGYSVELFGQAGAEDFLPELERYLAELQLRRGDLPRALLACELALATAARLEARAEEAITRRVYAQVLEQIGYVSEAWHELQQSLVVLREVNNRYETARTLSMMARIAPRLDQRETGKQAYNEAIALLHTLGAARDIKQLKAIMQQHGYE